MTDRTLQIVSKSILIHHIENRRQNRVASRVTTRVTSYFDEMLIRECFTKSTVQSDNVKYVNGRDIILRSFAMTFAQNTAMMIQHEGITLADLNSSYRETQRLLTFISKKL